MQSSLQSKIHGAFTPEKLEIVNESHKHASGLGAESHFKILIVSSRFIGVSRVARQRMVYDLLSEELKGGVHALSLRLLTPDESQKHGEFATPNCQGKARRNPD